MKMFSCRCLFYAFSFSYNVLSFLGLRTITSHIITNWLINVQNIFNTTYNIKI